VHPVRSAVLVVASLLLLVGAGGAAYALVLRQQTIHVRVHGAEKTVPEGTTLGEASDRFDLRPAAGDLLDVEGDVLRRGAYPGRLLLDGRTAPLAVELNEGDAIRVLDGKDRREPSAVSYVRIPAGMPANPEFTLARTPGTQELERGRISGKVVPLGFHATGPARTPKAVALTFDDGPSIYTRRILAVLERMHVRATFFVIGRQAKDDPSIVRHEISAGMEVGSHSYSHPYQPPFDRQPHEVIRHEISWTRGILARLGHEPTIFRPPGGAFSPYVIETAGSYGQRVVLWSVDPTDWRAGTTSRQIVRRVLGAVRPGAIVVLHDGGGDRTATIAALPRIIRGIRKRGLKIVPIDPEGRGAS
jgi:peptidoglycan/xylan/chitin deacetylase (PgdA/CDA1 family)